MDCGLLNSCDILVTSGPDKGGTAISELRQSLEGHSPDCRSPTGPRKRGRQRASAKLETRWESFVLLFLHFFFSFYFFLIFGSFNNSYLHLVQKQKK